MAAIIYSLCALTAASCSVLLFRGYRSSNAPLLFWSGLSFAGLTASNLLVVADELLLPLIDLAPWRVGMSVASIGVLVYGLILESS